MITQRSEYTPAELVRRGAPLRAALAHFGIDPHRRIAMDCGASLGGFSAVLLDECVDLLYAIDVVRGHLDPKVRANRRVVDMEGTDVKTLARLPGPRPDLVTVDLSFVSLRVAIPAIVEVAAPEADILAVFSVEAEYGRSARRAEEAATAVEAFCEWAEASCRLMRAKPPFAAPATMGAVRHRWFVHLRRESGPPLATRTPVR